MDLETTGLSARDSRVVAIGLAMEDGITVDLVIQPEQEVAAISGLLSVIAAQVNIGGTLVTYNGAGFDLPFLHGRAFIHGIRVPYSAQTLLRKYQTKPHADLCGLLANWSVRKGDTQAGWAAACRIENGDTLSGADIPHLVIQGEWDSIRAHCHADVSTLWSLALRAQASNLL